MTNYVALYKESYNEVDVYEPSRTNRATRQRYELFTNDEALKKFLLEFEDRTNVSDLKVHEIGPQVKWTKTISLNLTSV